MNKTSLAAVTALIICSLTAGCAGSAEHNSDESGYVETSSINQMCSETEKSTFGHIDDKETFEASSTDRETITEDIVTKPAETSTEALTEAPAVASTVAPTEAPAVASTAAPTEAPAETLPSEMTTEAMAVPPAGISQDTISMGQRIYEENKEVIEAVVNATNKVRTDAGLNPLTLDGQLCVEACIRASEMVQNNYFAHTRPDGSKYSTLLDSMGINGYSGENIAAGRTDAGMVINDWMNSERHRANLLDPRFTRIGVGYLYSDEYVINGTNYRTVWVQTFME